ncbi:MAG: histidine phosphatase family protein [Deltaproteobacteria bacterium]|nr:histidine phosphatase family protein [Deltaproteobacteria bacterium]
MLQQWPRYVWIVRHGESAGNLARHAAEAASLPVVDLEIRDCDVPLSALGERQADALGAWFAGLPEDERPTVILSSPYRRALDTARRICRKIGEGAHEVITDERLREREFGILDRLTKIGIAMHEPQQAELRKLLGKFYHRPPGGESWCDIILRLRSVLDSMSIEFADERILVVCHSVVVLCFRYLFERMTEDEIMAVDRTAEVANCSVTAYALDPSRAVRGSHMALESFNFVAPIEQAGERVTLAPDEPLLR